MQRRVYSSSQRTSNTIGQGRGPINKDDDDDDDDYNDDDHDHDHDNDNDDSDDNDVFSKNVFFVGLL